MVFKSLREAIKQEVEVLATRAREKHRAADALGAEAQALYNTVARLEELLNEYPDPADYDPNEPLIASGKLGSKEECTHCPRIGGCWTREQCQELNTHRAFKQATPRLCTCDCVEMSTFNGEIADPNCYGGPNCPHPWKARKDKKIG